MELNMRKEQYSYAYIRAVASVAGFSCTKPEVDDDSIDMTIAKRGGNGTIRSPRVDAQVKCSAADIVGLFTVDFSLKLKNYDELRSEDVLVPRILIVVVVPEQLDEWLGHSETEMSMRHCGYWTSLRGAPASPNSTSHTVNLPRTQFFTYQELAAMMARIGNGGMP
jgi:hypothetical protein